MHNTNQPKTSWVMLLGKKQQLLISCPHEKAKKKHLTALQYSWIV
jgi:hypothetical protein